MPEKTSLLATELRKAFLTGDLSPRPGISATGAVAGAAWYSHVEIGEHSIAWRTNSCASRVEANKQVGRRHLWAQTPALMRSHSAGRSAAQDISWIWWKIISGKTIRPKAWPANSTLAIGMPATRLFFEPQNTIAISS